MSLEIVKVKTAKHNIYQRPLMEEHIIPHHPSITIIAGSAGSGKSTLVNNMLSNPVMYKGYFDCIFLLIGSDDDMYDDLIEKGTINKQHVIKCPESADIQKIIDMQKKAIENSKDISKSPKILVIMDDLANNQKLLRSKPFLQLFVAGRHLNSSTFFLSQYLNLVPRACRLQANYLICFKMNMVELNVLTEQYCPATMNKKEFHKIVFDTVKDTKNKDGSKKINFMMITKGGDDNKRFRRNLDEYIVLDGQEQPELNINCQIDEDAEEALKKELLKAPNIQSSTNSEVNIILPTLKKGRKAFIMDR